jgi:hypothetical protein
MWLLMVVHNHYGWMCFTLPRQKIDEIIKFLGISFGLSITYDDDDAFLFV